MIRYVAAAATLTAVSKCAVAKGWADRHASGRAGWLAWTDPGKVFTALLLLLSCVSRTGGRVLNLVGIRNQFSPIKLYVKMKGTKNVAMLVIWSLKYFHSIIYGHFREKMVVGQLFLVPICSDGPVSVVPREIALGPSEIFHRRRRLCSSNNPFDKIMKETFWFIRRSFFSIRKEYGKVSFPHSSWIPNWLLFPY